MSTSNDRKTTPPKRTLDRPITIYVEKVEDLPQVRILPQVTQVTINLKMNRAVAKELVAHIQKQLDAPEQEIDFVASTLTGSRR